MKLFIKTHTLYKYKDIRERMYDNMKKKKIFITSLVTLGALGIGAISVSAYMCNSQDKAEILSELTGKSTNEIIEERVNEDKTYGTIALESGVLEKFQEKNLEQMKTNLNNKVEAGAISKEEADTIISNRENAMQNCDGTGIESKECNYQANKGMNCNGSGYNKNGLGKGLGQKNCINK